VSNEAILSHPLYKDLQQKHDALELRFNALLRLIQNSKQERFIPQSNPDQHNLFALPEPEALPLVEKITIERSKPQKKKDIVIAQGKRLPEHLRREVEIIEPIQDTTGCSFIGNEESEQLHFNPGELYVKVTRRPKYAKQDGQGVLIADMPDRIKGKALLGNSLLAKITTDKYVYHLPLYRQSKQMIEMGAQIAVSTLTDGVSYVYDAMLPLYEKVQELIFKENYLQADETPHKVLDSAIKGKSHMGYLWVYRAPQSGLAYFDYRKGRGREGPDESLKNYRGYLQTDGYQIYDNFQSNPNIHLTGCMAHARRKFFEAQKNDQTRAARVLVEMSKLYKVEENLRNENALPEQRKNVREQLAKPILTDLHLWMKEQAIQVTPKSPIGKALEYTLMRWHKLIAYCNNGILEIDNNLIENAIRPVALGRKNYLFAGSHEGAKRAAMMYTFFAMCKVNEVEPMKWLRETLDKLPSHPINRIEELLPWKNK